MLDPAGIVTSWNAGAERFKGYKSEEIIGKHFSTFYTEEDLEAGIPATGLRTAAQEGRFAAEGWRLRKDGTQFWANVVIDSIRDPSGELVGFAKVTRDLTARKLADEELRRSEERFRLLLQSVTDYAIYMLDTDGVVTSWNAGAQRFKGYTADEIIGQHFSRFYSEEDQAAGVPAQALKTAVDEGRFEAEGWRYRKDGSEFWANVVIDPVRDDSGQLIGFAKITRDLTERRRAQLSLEQAQQAFFQSQKMEAIGQLTGGVAHDFNNLLFAIIGSVDLARARLAQGADIGRFLDNIMQAAERGATLTHRMLAFARKQDLELQPVRLPELVRGMADLLERTIGPGITIDTRFPLILSPVRADAAQLELALMNLAVNARDAMPNGGTITLAARQQKVKVRNGLEPGDYVCLTVTDEGEGMDEATLARAIDPFFTTKGVGKGTGLGLSMVVGMAEQCGGKFTLHSTMGQGTIAEICLPVATAERIPAEPGAAPAKTTRFLDPLTVLVVDDDEIVLTNTSAMLADMGHTVIQSHSASEALRVLGKNRVDLMVTDYAMPGMTGAELITAVEGGWPALPVLMVSGYAEIPEGSALGVPRLAKPFRPPPIRRRYRRGCAGGFEENPELPEREARHSTVGPASVTTHGRFAPDQQWHAANPPSLGGNTTCFRYWRIIAGSLAMSGRQCTRDSVRVCSRLQERRHERLVFTRLTQEIVARAERAIAEARRLREEREQIETHWVAVRERLQDTFEAQGRGLGVSKK